MAIPFYVLKSNVRESCAIGCSRAWRVQPLQSLLASRSDCGESSSENLSLNVAPRAAGLIRSFGKCSMDTGVSFRRPLRRCAALVAAYAVALQAMFSAFALPTAHAPGADRIRICRSDRADAPAQPLPHEACPPASPAIARRPALTGPRSQKSWPVIDRPDAVRPPDAAHARGRPRGAACSARSAARLTHALADPSFASPTQHGAINENAYPDCGVCRPCDCEQRFRPRLQARVPGDRSSLVARDPEGRFGRRRLHEDHQHRQRRRTAWSAARPRSRSASRSTRCAWTAA